MGTTRYSPLLLAHLRSPSNFGADEEATHIGGVLSSEIAPEIIFYLRMQGERIDSIRFKTAGCAVTIGLCSILASNIHGWLANEAAAIDTATLQDWIESIPADRLGLLDVVLSALQNALSSSDTTQFGTPDASSASFHECASHSAVAITRQYPRFDTRLPACAARHDVRPNTGVYFCAHPQVFSQHSHVTAELCRVCSLAALPMPANLRKYRELPIHTGPCEYLGEFQELRPCKTCRGNVMTKVFNCNHSAHRQTTMKECAACYDYVAKHATDAE
ncbi:iron-sulfur cluster assembly scaffold protein [Lacipirellula parvula]|uniref:NIF system FeS cluster assembly NifU N-terminal domain-containing protein n=1 Tax=Lacipirellula parvula TaxID=2650471 RepID=A0A5K7XJM3_9BACT|nr:hypothetical protein PLANPX_4045 [Lacipirellula parvula]